MMPARWIAVQIEVPEGASHFTGNLLSEAEFYKCVSVVGFPQWFWWDADRGKWMLYLGKPPHSLQPIKFLESPCELVDKTNGVLDTQKGAEDCSTTISKRGSK